MGLFNKAKKENNSCCCSNADNLIIKDNNEQENKCICGTGREDSTGDAAAETKEGKKLILKVLGSGCKNCVTLTENVKAALEEMKLEAEIIKVTDFAEITGYGIMTTPALVINEKVVSYGKVLKTGEAVKILEKAVSELN